MHSKVFIILLFCFSAVMMAQSEPILITEQKKGKRVVLQAENKTADTLNVFLMVHSEGYRRSADKPVLKNIPPRSTIPMITLIELTDQPSSYTYELIVNDTEKNDEIDYEKEVVDIENALRGKIVFFALPDCEKCIALADGLTEARVAYRTFDIAEDPVLYRQFMQFIAPELKTETRIRFPLIWNKDHTVFGYDDLESVISLLTN